MVDYANYGKPSKVFGAWWGANLRGVKEHPVNLGQYQSQLVYSPHDYGPEVHPQEWFYLKDDSKTFSRQTLLDDYWYDTWAYIVEENIAPLLMGEWGGFVDEEHDKTGENVHWLTELRDYMIEKHIHHTFWCFNENSSDTGGLVYDNFGKWDDVKYAFVKPALWQTEDGKFISLDHAIPLGKNGITLSEYYGGTPTPTEPPKETDAPTSEEATAAPTEPTTAEAPTETTEATTQTPAYGDVTLDGEVDILDVIALNKFLLGSAKLDADARANADTDGNTTLDSTDSLNILKFVVEIIEQLPVA